MTPTSNVAAATSSYPSEATSQISDLAEQLQKLLATQPQAMTASFVKSLNPSDIPGPTFQEADWDMP
jgi:hypothetical protein